MNLDHISNDIIAKAQKIRFLVLDVDGILTDGSLYFDDKGNEALKVFNSKDGQGIKLLQQANIKVGIITARNSVMVTRRATELGIEHLIQGRKDKLVALPDLFDDAEIDYQQIGYMGDDLADLSIMRRVGLAMTAADGHWFIRQQSHWISQYGGGKGAVREACDLILLAQDKFNALVKPFM